jgi:hypothetical protein
LVFPKFIRGTFNDALVTGQALHARTELEISVRCPDGATCTDGQVVRMRAHWVCPGCTESSFNLQTTVNGSLYFNTEGVSVVDVAGVPVITAAAFPNNATTVIAQPPCLRGYLLVWVIDGGGNPIKFDGLIGDAILRDGTPGEEHLSARAYNAIPIQAADFLNTGNATDGDGDGNLDFNGSEYQMLTGRIFGTVRYDDQILLGGTVETDLTLLTLDVRSNLVNPRTDVKLNFYSTDEGLTDTAVSFTCWTERPLSSVRNNTAPILASLNDATMGRKGLVESDGPATQFDFATGVTTPATVLGIVYTREGTGTGTLFSSFRDYAYSLSHDGDPVETEFVP